MALFDDDHSIESGCNAAVECDGVRYLVQTQCSMRDEPVIESLVFRGGEVLVRITASWGEIARRCGFSSEDGQHLLDVQHADLIRKIRHGLLRDIDPPRGDVAPEILDATGRTFDPSEIDDPAVRELLRALGVEKPG